MGFTTIDSVRLMLMGPSGNSRHVSDEKTQFDGNNQTVLCFLPVELESVIVKGLRRNQLFANSVLLTNTDWSSLPNAQIVPDTVAVTDSVLLQKFFVEGQDFQVDYVGGKIRRIDHGDIRDGDSVSVYYQTYDIFVLHDDYEVDGNTGVVNRSISGTILNNEIVWIDYTIAEGGAPDDLLTAAIASAHAQIVARLAPPYSDSSTDALLASGETELACAIAARALAGKPLLMSRDTSSDDRALAWLRIAEQFEQSAWKTLQGFLVQPRRHNGYAVKNG